MSSEKQINEVLQEDDDSAKETFDVIMSMLDNEDFSLQSLIENENFTIVTMDSDKDAFFNMNTPDDYETVVSLKTRSS